ncbi:ATP-dependent Clp protease adaptor ClpS [Psychroflexus aestuariivivens]|uniref:ATP-dependent Clp protease adaptor ClpS n=1 Tax=Psychroflexus aestuariivivens TaxID=1795040 RepID=UPI000FD83500|nr:ATP-dependent Clp protease adaptor ClpS [Psychroflexus aestuariivivens]
MSVMEEVLEEVVVEEKLKDSHEIVVFNDDINTFDHVIETLIKTCDHDLVQAEQCTLLIHYKGKCAVKSGEFEDLKPRCSKILEAGISAEIQ